MNTIFISCGHNAARTSLLSLSKDFGAVDPKNKENTEYRWVRKVATQIYKIGFASMQYIIQILPEGLNLQDRIKYINKRAVDGDICIELHMNAGGGSGVEVFAHAESTYAMRKASEISAKLAIGMGLSNRGGKPDIRTRFGRLGFIRETRPLAYLIELGFIDNEKDRDAVWMKGAESIISLFK